MPTQRLKPHAADSAIWQLVEELGRTDRTRMEALAPLVQADGAIPMGEASIRTRTRKTR